MSETREAKAMQTFLPSSDYESCAIILDKRRKFNQCNEGLVILNTLLGAYNKKRSWKNHPAVKMWAGYEHSLADYIEAMCIQSSKCGIIHTRFQALAEARKLIPADASRNKPYWLGGKIHETHQAALLRKNPDYYSGFKWNVDVSIPYFWPVT